MSKAVKKIAGSTFKRMAERGWLNDGWFYEDWSVFFLDDFTRVVVCQGHAWKVCLSTKKLEFFSYDEGYLIFTDENEEIWQWDLNLDRKVNLGKLFKSKLNMRMWAMIDGGYCILTGFEEKTVFGEGVLFYHPKEGFLYPPKEYTGLLLDPHGFEDSAPALYIDNEYGQVRNIYYKDGEWLCNFFGDKYLIDGSEVHDKRFLETHPA